LNSTIHFHRVKNILVEIRNLSYSNDVKNGINELLMRCQNISEHLKARLESSPNYIVDSDIAFVPCNEETYKRPDNIIKNDMEHFLCRKPRQRCTQVINNVVGNHVSKVEGW